MNSAATIDLENPSGQFRPFNEVRGTANWQLGARPKSLELRLFWFTSGRGNADAGVVEVKSLDPSTYGQAAFSFTLPGAPYSLSGSLITIQWALELVAKPGRQLALKELICAPSGVPLELPVIQPGKTRWWENGVGESAGINRLGIENERVLQRTTSH